VTAAITVVSLIKNPVILMNKDNIPGIYSISIGHYRVRYMQFMKGTDIDCISGCCQEGDKEIENVRKL
jgi:hypothetical protein